MVFIRGFEPVSVTHLSCHGFHVFSFYGSCNVVWITCSMELKAEGATEENGHAIPSDYS